MTFRIDNLLLMIHVFNKGAYLTFKAYLS